MPLPYLTINDYTDVPVMPDTAKYEERDHPQDHVRLMFDGSPSSSLRTRVRIWNGIETQWLTPAREAEILAAINEANPASVGGRMVGGGFVTGIFSNVKSIAQGKLIINGLPTDVRRLAFDFWEIPA